MEYSIGFKIDELKQTFNLHTLVLTPNKQIGIIDYAPNIDSENIKVKMYTNDENKNAYYSCEKKDLTVVIPFIVNSDCKEFTIKEIDNYNIFKNKNEKFKENELVFENGVVLYVPNKNYENPTLEQCIVYLEDKYKFSSTADSYAVNMVLNELYNLKYGINK